MLRLKRCLRKTASGNNLSLFTEWRYWVQEKEGTNGPPFNDPVFFLI